MKGVVGWDACDAETCAHGALESMCDAAPFVRLARCELVSLRACACRGLLFGCISFRTVSLHISACFGVVLLGLISIVCLITRDLYRDCGR